MSNKKGNQKQTFIEASLTSSWGARTWALGGLPGERKDVKLESWQRTLPTALDRTTTREANLTGLREANLTGLRAVFVFIAAAKRRSAGKDDWGSFMVVEKRVAQECENNLCW